METTIGAPEVILLLLIIALTIVPLAVGILALLDIAQRPEQQFLDAGQSRTTWLVVAILSLVVPCVFLAVAYYLLAIRPKLPARGTT